MAYLLALGTIAFFSATAYKVGKRKGRAIGYREGYYDCFDAEWN